MNEDITAPFINKGVKPTIAILREQGVNSHYEMAAAFDRAGFNAIDVHMSDLMIGRRNLAEFNAMVACGGFSYGDVLGAGAVGQNPSYLTRNYTSNSASFYQSKHTDLRRM